MDRLIRPEIYLENLPGDRKVSLTVQEEVATSRVGQEVEVLQAAGISEIGIVSANEIFEMAGICGTSERAIGTGRDGIETLTLESHVRRPRPERGRGHRLEEVFVICETVNREIWT